MICTAYGASGSSPTFFVQKSRSRSWTTRKNIPLSTKVDFYMVICIFPEGDLDSISLIACYGGACTGSGGILYP